MNEYEMLIRDVLFDLFNVRVHVVNVTNARFFVRSVLCCLTSQYLMTEYA